MINMRKLFSFDASSHVSDTQCRVTVNWVTAHHLLYWNEQTTVHQVVGRESITDRSMQTHKKMNTHPIQVSTYTVVEPF